MSNQNAKALAEELRRNAADYSPDCQPGDVLRRAAAFIESQVEAIRVKDEALRSMLLQHGRNLGTRLMAEANDLARAAIGQKDGGA